MTQARDKALFNQNKRLLKAALPIESTCPYCNALMSLETNCPYAFVSIDHMTAYTKGGGDELENLIACCANCNTRKGNSKQGLSFRMQTPKRLNAQEYQNLNDYLDVSQRIEILREVLKSLTEGNFPQAITLSEQGSMNTLSRSFFSKLTINLQDLLHPKNVNVKYKGQAEAVKSVVIRLKAELDKMSTLKDETQQIDFVLYSIL